jgi:hypothetical protein
MSFTEIPTSWLDVGDPLRKELFDRIRENQNDINTRIENVETNANKIVIFNEIVVNAATLSAGGTVTGLDLYRCQGNFNLTDCKVWIFEKNSLTGNLEVDIQVSSSADFTSSNSVFTTKPRIVYSTALDYDESANAVFNASFQSVSLGDYLRLDISELPSGGTLGKFGIYFIGEIA